METDSPPNLKRSLVVLAKFGYYEMASVITLSAHFWIASLPVLTIGAAGLALFDVFKTIYREGIPRSEVARMRLFRHSVRENLVRGLPLTAIILFVFINTYWYFGIALSGGVEYYIVGGLAGLYACLIAVLFTFRTANLMARNEPSWWLAARSATESWIHHPHITILQGSVAAIALLVSVALPAALLFVLPSVLVVFELVIYEELTGADPRLILDRYGTPT